MVRWIVKIFGQGLAVLIPISLTVGLVVFVAVWFERLLAKPFQNLFPETSEFYRMGMGLAAFCAIVFMMGLLMKLWLVRRVVGWIEARIIQLPLVKTVYGAIKDVMKFIGGGSGGAKGDMVVMVTQPNGWRQLGIVTRQEFGDIPAEVLGGNTNLIAVYLPFSYQLGGFTYFIDRSQCEPVPGMRVEDAMRYSVMAWLGSAAASQTSSRGDAAKVDSSILTSVVLPEGKNENS